MHGSSMVQRKRNRRNEDIFHVVRGLVGTIENLQEDLHGVLDDIKILLRQIDSVTEKIEESYSDGNDGKVGGTGKCQAFKSRNRLDDVKVDDASPDLDLSYLTITSGNQKCKWGHSLYESPTIFRRDKSTSLSPLASRHQGNLSEYQVIRNDRVTVSPVRNKRDITADKKYLFRRLSDAVTEIKRSPTHYAESSPVATCYAQFKTQNVLEEEPHLPQKGYLSDNSKDNRSIPVDNMTVRDVNYNTPSEQTISDPKHQDDEDIYEKLMESQLEKMSATSDLSGCSEWSDNYMDFGTFSASDQSYSDGASVQYDREVNPWTSFTLNHTSGSTKSSESYVSDTPSDILNDNTKSTTSTLADMIFSDQLVRASNRRVLKQMVTSQLQ